MTRFTFQAFTNETQGSRFFRFNDGDLVRYAGSVTVEAETVEVAREIAWAVGNREAVDANGQRWPFWVRSLSVGDLLCEIGPEIIVGHAVAPCGFTEGLVLGFSPEENGVRVQVRCDCGKGDLCPRFGSGISWGERGPQTEEEYGI